MLARDERVRLVYLFGSAADPRRETVRDLDLAILSSPPLDLDELLKLRADVVTSVGVPIDLVSLNSASIVLAHEVADSGVCLYSAADGVDAEFAAAARARYWDFRPFLDEQWRLSGERLKERLRGSAT